MWPWTHHGASWALGSSTRRELAQIPSKLPRPWQASVWSAVTSYHVWVEGWGQPFVVQVIPVYGAEEYVVLDLRLQKEGADQKQPSPWVLPVPPHMALSPTPLAAGCQALKPLLRK